MKTKTFFIVFLNARSILELMLCNQNLTKLAVDSVEFHWRTLVPFVLELYISSTGVPLENLRSTGAPGHAPGHGVVCHNQGHVQVTKLMNETMS